MTTRGLTKAEVAKRIGRSPSAVGNWAAAVNPPDPAAVFAIEEALDLAPGTLSRILGYCPCDEPATITFVQALSSDPTLPPGLRTALLGVYDAFVNHGMVPER